MIGKICIFKRIDKRRVEVKLGSGRRWHLGKVRSAVEE